MKKTKLYGWYTLFFTITALLSFSAFWLHSRTFVWDADGFMQYYPILKYLKDALKSLMHGSFSLWTWKAGLGTDTLSNFALVFFDPFSWLAAAFPVRYLDVGYTVSIILKLFCAGLSMTALLRYQKKDDRLCVIGGIGYALSNWAAGCICHTFFEDALLLFPLIILGIEKNEKEKKSLLLVAAVFFSFLTSVYFSYMTAIQVGIYIVVHYIVAYKEKTVKNGVLYFARYIGLVFLSLCLAAVVVIPAVYTLVMAPKSTGNEMQLFHEAWSYIAYLPSLLTNSQIYWNYSYMGSAALFTVMIPCLFCRAKAKKASSYTWTFWVLFGVNLFALFGSIMNGLSYTSGRWCYGITFFFIVASVEALELPEVQEKSYQKTAVWFLAALGILLFVVGWLVFHVGNTQTIITGFLNILIGILCIWLLGRQDDKKKYEKLLAVVAVNLILVYNTLYSDAVTTKLSDYQYAGESYDEYEASPQKAATKIKDKGFYRVDSVEGASASSADTFAMDVHTPANENLYYGTRTLYTYLSTIDSRLFAFHKALCNAGGYYRRICTYSNDNRARMDYLLGVKYFLGNYKNSELKASDYAPYGFQKSMRKAGASIWKTDYSTGLGFVYYNVMKRSEFEKLDYFQREQVMMGTGILDDTADERKLPVKNASEIPSQGKDSAYEIVKTDGVEMEGDSLRVTQENGSVTLHIKPVEHAEIYCYFDNLQREILPEEAENAFEIKKYEFTTKRLCDLMKKKEAEDFALTVSAGEKKKKAINPLDENQSFADIEDYLIHLGYYDRFKKNITISFSKTGNYTFDALRIIAVGMENFASQAVENKASAFRSEKITDNYVKGAVSCKQDGLLYLSMINNPGWKVYVDGERVKNTATVNYAFMGIPVQKGEHVVELRYRPVGFYPGLALFGIGIIGIAALFVWERKKGCK